ncbi:MAG TPA: hypothetical protein VLE02_00930 [Nitrosarchaeum sp.]|nr:hypothetical protein [Nitrosarchaeum sp.]
MDPLLDRIDDIERQISSTKRLVHHSRRDLIISSVCSIFIIIILMITIKPKFVMKEGKISVLKLILYAILLSLIAVGILYFLLR